MNEKRLLKGIAHYILEHINKRDLDKVIFTVLHDLEKYVNKDKFFISRTDRFADLKYKRMN